MMVSDPDYQNHFIFGKLNQYIAFYESLAASVFRFVSMGTKAALNIDSYVFSSIQGTLTSICTILRDGRINDAYALLRKYYDSVVINIYSDLYLQDNFGIANFVVARIENWRKGTGRLPKYRIMSQYIQSSTKVAAITALLHSDNRYKNVRERCNDHTHYNFYRNVLLNDSHIALPERGSALAEFATDLRDVLIFHVSYLFSINEHYMMSSDYLDALDCGLPPEPDSQYLVAPYVQEIFEQVIVSHRPDVAAALKKNTIMHL